MKQEETKRRKISTSTAGPAPEGYMVIGKGRVSLLIPRRYLFVTGLFALLCVALGILALGVGTTSYTYADIWDVMRGEGRHGARLVLLERRLPRILLAITVGWALGVAGAIFQTVTRNPLGSPDIIGFSMGAQTGILLAVLLLSDGLAFVSMSALAGGLIAGSVIYLLAHRGGFGGVRLILGGIAVSSMLGSLNRWLILQADSDEAYGALRAITGTLGAAEWKITIFASLATFILTALTLLRSRDVQIIPLGDDLASSLGMNQRISASILIFLGTALVGVATMAAGPIAFIALLAPHIARIIAREPISPLLFSGLIGSMLLLVCDVGSQILLDSMPVGTVAAAVGGIYFMTLLVTEMRYR